jgi:molybdate transport system substrate-binding protein
LSYFELDEAALAESGAIVYGSSAKKVAAHLKDGTADCCILFGSDAVDAGLTVVATASKKMCSQNLYPAAVLHTSKHLEEALAFMEYLKSDEADAVFKACGLTPRY